MHRSRKLRGAVMRDVRGLRLAETIGEPGSKRRLRRDEPAIYRLDAGARNKESCMADPASDLRLGRDWENDLVAFIGAPVVCFAVRRVS